MTRAHVGGAAVLLIALIWGACAPASAPPQVPAQATPTAATSPEVAELYEKAKAEGKVVFAWFLDEPTAALAAAFSKRFPGITVSTLNASANVALSKVLPELRAGGKASIDVSQMTVSVAKAALEMDAFASFAYAKAFRLPESEVTFDNRFVHWRDSAWVIIYNSDLVSAADAPRGYEDLLSPKWAGAKMVLDTNGTPFEFLSHPSAWGFERAKAFVTKLAAQKLQFVQRTGEAASVVGSGQASIGIGLLSDARRLQARGAPVKIVVPDPLVLARFFSVAYKKVEHPNAAILMAGWLASDREAQEILEKMAFDGKVRVGDGANEAGKLVSASGAKVVLADEAIEASARYADWQKEIVRILGATK